MLRACLPGALLLVGWATAAAGRRPGQIRSRVPAPLYNERPVRGAIAAADGGAHGSVDARDSADSDRCARLPRALSRKRDAATICNARERLRRIDPNGSSPARARSSSSSASARRCTSTTPRAPPPSVFEQRARRSGTCSTGGARERVLDWWAQRARPRRRRCEARRDRRRPSISGSRDANGKRAERASAQRPSPLTGWRRRPAAAGRSGSARGTPRRRAGCGRRSRPDHGAALRGDLDRLVVQRDHSRARQAPRKRRRCAQAEVGAFKESWETDRSRQWPRSLSSSRPSSSSPIPTSTVSGTFERLPHAPCARARARRSRRRAPRGTSNSSSSWTVRIIRRARARGSSPARACDVDHGALHDVGRRPLNRHVHGHPLGRRADLTVPAGRAPAPAAAARTSSSRRQSSRPPRACDR